MNMVYEKYFQEKEYLKSFRIQLILITAVFIVSAIAGYIYASLSPEFASAAMGELDQLVEIIEDLPLLGIMLFIFFNNAIKSLFALVMGVAFGIIPLLFIAYNGVILGVVVQVIAAERGFMFVVAGILPHGIIELPVVLISSAIGMKAGYETLKAVSGKDANIKEELVKGIRFYMKWIVPLLFVAAVIETFITPLFIFMTGI
ncbi:protein of unknown function DUF95 transmembrane [Methanosalsum zhilinae DSM 4017]|uniref:Stage II sporulation protein M n=2 Tax=Methanosalsum zhilinae TaxID=39669 RepID=F7XPS5_METZD|nr:protein of unknown function DUF95 transmembrane [Methanosalsum zhilinae DSM 4017]